MTSTGLPRADVPPTRRDLLAILRYHFQRDEAALDALLMGCRLDPYALIAMLCGYIEESVVERYGNAGREYYLQVIDETLLRYAAGDDTLPDGAGPVDDGT